MNQRTIKTISGILFFAIIGFSLNLQAGKIKLGEEDRVSLQQSYQSYQTASFSNYFPAIYHEVFNTPDGKFEKFIIPGYTKNMQPGSPLLPVKRLLIEVPAGASPLVRIVSYDVTEYDLTELGIKHKLFPAQPPHSKSEDFHEFIYDPSAYAIDSYGEKEIVSVEMLGSMRGVNIARIDIAPVKYNPVQHTIKVYNNIKFDVDFEGADVAKTIALKAKNASPYYKALNTQLMNRYEMPANRDNFMRYPIKYVIVSDPMFQSQLQPFIEWKTQKGFTVIEAYTDNPDVGNTTTSIKSYLQGLYDDGTPDDPAPSFVLFVGDVDQIPAWSGNAGYHVSDLYYCEYTNDYLPEIYYGRFSAETTDELQPQIDKTLQYEKYQMPDPSYLNEVVMVAGMDGTHGNDWANGQINYGTINYFNNAHGLLSHTYLYPESGNHSADIIGHVSDGVGYGNYTAHCGSNGWSDPSFNTSDIPGLQNLDKYGLLVGNCCSSNTFDSDECFGEAILRAEDKGALGYIGGSNSTYWDPDYYWGVGVGEITENPPPYEETTLGAYDRTFHDHGEDFADWYMSQDEMIYAGNLSVTEGDPGSAEYYWEIYHLMGDPSVQIYFSEPPAANVSYQNMLPVGATTFEITTDPYAYVGISKDGVLHGAGIADDQGNLTLDIDPFSIPGTADVIVTCQNVQPYIGTLTVASPDGPYIIFNDFTITDNAGNNNGEADYNEQITLNVGLENVGNDDASDVSAVISTEDEYVEIINDNNDWGEILSGEILIKDDAFELNIDEYVPDQHSVSFTISMDNESKEQWVSDFSMTINAPVLQTGFAGVDDSQNGNGNGRLDPGETADILFPLSNTGHAALENILAELACANGMVTLNSATYSIDNLNPEDNAIAIFNISTDEAMQVGTSVTFNFSASSGAYSVEKDVSMSVGLIMEDFESGDFTAFGWVHNGDADWTICEEAPYEGAFCVQSGEINDNMVSELILDYEVASDDSISFFRKVSCEDDPFGTGYDFLAFYIDDVEMGAWDGEHSWGREAYAVSQGSHTFKWMYNKDYSVSGGDDCAWVDYIIFPAEPNYVGQEDVKFTNHNVRVFPNPATEEVNLEINLENPSNISVRILNILGQPINALSVEKEFPSGANFIKFNTDKLSKGIYHIETTLNGQQRIIKKLMIIK